jgi:beta-mannanase
MGYIVMSNTNNFIRSLSRILLILLVVGLGACTSVVTFWFMSSQNNTTLAITESSTSVTKNRMVELGIVDPDSVYSLEEKIKNEHVFIPWGEIHLEASTKKINAISKSRNILITVEPFKDTEEENLLLKITRGEYDKNVVDICSMLKETGKEVTIRYAHEMDVKKSIYPWASFTPTQYILAYKKFVTTCKSVFDTAKFMWSPNGETTANDYFPGREYVDVIGLSAYGYPEFEKTAYGKLLTFDEMFGQKYDVVALQGMPIVIAEFGAGGELAYQTEYLNSALESIKHNKNYPLLTGMYYFNYFNPTPWIPGISKPDFRVNQDQLNTIISPL